MSDRPYTLLTDCTDENEIDFGSRFRIEPKKHATCGADPP